MSHGAPYLPDYVSFYCTRLNCWDNMLFSEYLRIFWLTLALWSCLSLYLGLTFDIYEGQITALLGHSGAGKSTLMNILCGICPPTNGSATIYGSPVAEIADGSEMKQLVGICPQFNIIFDVLTVEEHLMIFAAIKGIPPAEIAAEVIQW